MYCLRIQWVFYFYFYFKKHTSRDEDIDDLKITVKTVRSNDLSHVDAPDVTILPRMPQKTLQNNNAAKAHDLKRHAHDIARDSHGIEDEIRAMVSSYMAPKDDEDPELAIG